MVTQEPLISVVMPAHNSGRFLAATLDSVVGQTERRWECVIVDDGSTDDTNAIATRYAEADPRIRVISIEQQGVCNARNEGFRRIAEGSKFVTFMDSDDVWLPMALEILLSRLDADERFIGSHGLAEFIDVDDRAYAPGEWSTQGQSRLGLENGRLIRWPLDRPTTFDVLINGNVLFPPGLILARRQAYEMAGPFDPALDIAGDWDMLIRLSRFGDLAFVNDVILHYRRHDSNLGLRPETAAQAWLVRCLGFHAPENSPAQQEVARRGWRAYQRRLAGERLAEIRSALRRKRELRTAAFAVARLAVYAVRYVRGYPRPRVRREPLSW